MKRIVTALTFCITLSLSLTAQKTPAKAGAKPQPVVLKTLMDSFSYAAGVNVAKNMKEQGITDLNPALLARAMEDVFKGRPIAASEEKLQASLNHQLQNFADQKTLAQKSAGIIFLQNNKKDKDVVTLPDGLQYKVIKAGDPNANKPGAFDTVVVNYIGTLIDGKEFDNSYKRGQPAVFGVKQVIRGWQEILQLMPVGSHWKVFIPSELGYGEEGGPGGAVPPHAVMIFDITLEGIKPATNPPPAQ